MLVITGVVTVLPSTGEQHESSQPRSQAPPLRNANIEVVQAFWSGPGEPWNEPRPINLISMVTLLNKSPRRNLNAPNQ